MGGILHYTEQRSGPTAYLNASVHVLPFIDNPSSLEMASQLKPRVVVTRHLGPDVMPLLTGRDDIELDLWPHDSVVERKWLLEHIRGAAGLLVTAKPSERVDAELLDAAGTSLRVVSTMSVGYDQFDTAEITKRGVRMGYTPGVLTDAVADLTVMLALMAGRNVGQTLPLVTSGQWPTTSWAPFKFCGPQLSTTPASPTRTVGFLGFGRISQATLARLIPFGITHCLYASTSTNNERDATLLKQHPSLKVLKKVDMDELARESDIFIVLAPGGKDTHHLVDEAFLRKMKKTSVLVNAARGTLVDTDALVRALKEGWIWGAGLDVVEGEPNVSADHSLIKEPRCVMLPHIGSATLETRIGMATLAINNVLSGVFGDGMPEELKF